MRGLGQGLNLDDWLHQAIWPFEKEHLDAPTVGLGAELAMVEMLMSGITTFSDMYFFPETVASVAERLGLNIQLAVPIISLDTRWARGSEECIHRALALHDLYRDHQHVSVSFGPHSVEALDLETLEKTLGKIDKVIVDNNAGSGVVPYLPLPELKKKINNNSNSNNEQN